MMSNPPPPLPFWQSLKEQELAEAVKYVSRSPDIIESIRSALRYQPSQVSKLYINTVELPDTLGTA
jgi:hypothetical protein